MLPDSPGSMHGADALLRRLEKGKCCLSLHGVESTDLHISCPFPGTFEFGNSFFFFAFFFFLYFSPCWRQQGLQMGSDCGCVLWSDALPMATPMLLVEG